MCDVYTVHVTVPIVKYTVIPFILIPSGGIPACSLPAILKKVLNYTLFPIKVKLRMLLKQARSTSVIDNFEIVDIIDTIKGSLYGYEK